MGLRKTVKTRVMGYKFLQVLRHHCHHCITTTATSKGIDRESRVDDGELREGLIDDDYCIRLNF